MNEKGFEHITLSQIGNGSLEERFQEELQKILVNIQDPNTKPVDQRKITMTVAFKPNEDRDDAQIMIGVSSSLASYKQVSTSVFLSTDKDKDGKYYAEERLRRNAMKNQTIIDDYEEVEEKPEVETANVKNLFRTGEQ